MKHVCYKDILLYIPERNYNKDLTNRFKNNVYEKQEEYLINKYFNNNDIVLEVGSCLGFITVLLSRIVDSVISIEANPELINTLETTISKNNVKNVQLINGYISNTEEAIKFQTYDIIVAGSGDREDLSTTNIYGWGDSLKIYDVECIKIVDILNFEKINSIVLDIEGGELKFLNENFDFIKNKINKITIELHGNLMSDNKFNQKCIKILNDLEFKLVEKINKVYYFEKIK